MARRVSELPSEDPIHAGEYGKEMVSGMQEPDVAGHPKMLAYLKHYTAYSREQNRRYSEANISTFDLYDTYVRQYELAFKANPHAPSGVMCSYASINGIPSCASDLLLNKLLRQEWGQPNALVTTDCGSIEDILGKLEPSPGHTRLAATPEEAAAWAIMNGTDLEAGGTIYADHLMNATKLGLASEAAVMQAARRALRQHFVVGRFDSGVWEQLTAKDINSTRHQQVQAEAASQGMVLLKNEGLL
jgi:beta-glucosidase-like glycosyl hydrolase